MPPTARPAGRVGAAVLPRGGKAAGLPADLTAPDRVAGLARRALRAVRLWSFERLYNELAWAYDAAAWLASGGRWRTWQRCVRPYLVPGPLLEVGPGPGHLLAELLDEGHDAFGLELSPAMLRRANWLLGRRGWQGRLVRGDALRLPFADATFASVVLTFPAGYVFDPGFGAEAARVLRPAGRLVVVLAASARNWPGLPRLAFGRAVPRAAGTNGRAADDWKPVPDSRRAVRLAPDLAGEETDLSSPAGVVRLLVAAKT